MARSRRGQAELIAATIAISVFVLVVVFMILSVTATGYVSTSALAERARFENERQLEKLAYIYDPNYRECIITNAGAVEIKIVRVWKPDGTVYTPSDLKPIKPGERLPITDWGNVVYIVTARGNVFPVQSRCQELMALSAVSQSGGTSGGSAGTPPVTSNEFVTRSDFLRLGGEYGILCSVSGRFCRYVLYYDTTSKSWIKNDGTGWTSASNVNLVRDLNGDGIYELVLADPNYNEIVLGRNFEANITFVDVVEITSDVDTIYVYYELVIVISGTGNPHEAPFAISVVLSNETADLEFPSTFAWFATQPRSRSQPVIVVIQGSATIPIKAYESLREGIKAGIYNLTLRLTYYPDASVRVNINFARLQKLAIAGAKIVWQRSLQS